MLSWASPVAGTASARSAGDTSPCFIRLWASRAQRADFRQAGFDRAANCLADDLDRWLTFYQFPKAHWSHLRTTNVIESPFAGVRLRADAAKRLKMTKSGVYLVHQVLQPLSQTWRHLKSAHLCGQVPLPAGKAKSGRKTNAA